jgi:hypothetical protein
LAVDVGPGSQGRQGPGGRGRDRLASIKLTKTQAKMQEPDLVNQHVVEIVRSQWPVGPGIASS